MGQSMEVGDEYRIRDEHKATVIESHRDDDRHDVAHVAEVDGDIADQLIIDTRDNDQFDGGYRTSSAAVPCAWSELTDMHRVIEKSRDTVKHSTDRRGIEHIVETVEDDIDDVKLSSFAFETAIATLDAWEATGRL